MKFEKFVSLFLLICFFVFILSTAKADTEPCYQEANAQYEILIKYSIETHKAEVEDALQKLTSMTKRKCFKRDDVDDPEYLLFMDPRFDLEAHSNENLRKSYWDRKKDYVDFVSVKGNSTEALNVKGYYLYDYKKFHPESISLDPVMKIKPADEKTKKEQCSTVDNIIPRLPPVRDQGAAGWCDYYATADLLSFKTGRNISAIYLSELINPFGDGGASAETYNYVIKNFGLCEEKSMPSNGISKNYQDELRGLDDHARDYRQHLLTKSCPSDADLMGRYPRRNLQQIAESILFSVHGNGEIEDLKIPRNIEGGKIQFTKPSVAQHLALDACQKDRTALKPLSDKIQLEMMINNSSSEKFKKIDEILTSGNPINVGFNFKDLYYGSHSVGPNHAASVVGRKWDHGECKYQIRNSYGESFCPDVDQKKAVCEPPGYFWVNGETLYKATTEIQYVK